MDHQKRTNTRLYRGYVWRCLYLLIVYILLVSCAKSKVYKHTQWKAFKEKHKRLAFLPFPVSYSFDQRPKRLSQQEIDTLEQKAGEGLRQDLYAHFLAQNPGKRMPVQAIASTDSVLKVASINKVPTNQYKDLASLLAVDAVFRVELTTHYFRSEAEALAIMIFSIFPVSTKTIQAEATLHDGNSGELVWKYQLTFKGGLLDSERKIRKILKKKIIKRFPYR